MITSTTDHRSGIPRITAVALAAAAVLICAAACKPRRSLSLQKNESVPAVARVHSFAQNEVRLDVITNGATSLRVMVGHRVETVAIGPAAPPDLRLVFKTVEDGFVVSTPEGSPDIEFPGMSEVVFLEPPFDDGRTVMLGTCLPGNSGPAAIRIEAAGPAGQIVCEMPSFQSTPFDLTQYRFRHLPAMRDMEAALADLRAGEGNDEYSLWQPQRKPAGRNYQGQAYWALTTWPPNASECVTYMVTVGLPDERTSIWQVFVIDPESGEVSLIRDRKTGAIISLHDWLELEEKTAVYTLDEMLRGVTGIYKKRQGEGEAGAALHVEEVHKWLSDQKHQFVSHQSHQAPIHPGNLTQK